MNLLCKIFGHKFKEDFIAGTKIEEYVVGTGFGCSIHTGQYTKIPLYATKLLDSCSRCGKEKNSNNPQYIICSAIWFDDKTKHVHQPKNIETGFVICGRRHHNCFTSFKVITELFGIKDNMAGKSLEKEQGFLTDDDLFVNRKDAYKIALKANQCVKKNNEILFSEDIY